MPLILLAIFIIVPLAELYVIIKLGGAIGAGPTVFLLLADSIVGAMLLRSQGRGAWVRFNRALTESRVPAKEVVDGVLVVFGGALLLTPGFLTDALGLVLLIPPTRALVRGFMRRFAIGRFAMGPRAAMWGYGRVRDRGAGGTASRGPFEEPSRGRPRAAPEDFDWTSPRPAGPRADDIEGTAHELRDEDELPPGERGTFPG